MVTHFGRPSNGWRGRVAGLAAGCVWPGEYRPPKRFDMAAPYPAPARDA